MWILILWSIMEINSWKKYNKFVNVKYNNFEMKWNLLSSYSRRKQHDDITQTWTTRPPLVKLIKMADDFILLNLSLSNIFIVCSFTAQHATTKSHSASKVSISTNSPFTWWRGDNLFDITFQNIFVYFWNVKCN